MAAIIVVIIAIVAVVVSSFVSPAGDQFGKYIGTVKTEWLPDGRNMRLLETFTYVDPHNNNWVAPVGSVVDGASIPTFAWPIIGGPFEGKYRDASVIHDVACDKKSKSWESVHEMFYWAMLASGVEPDKAKVMYAAVYFRGPRWKTVVTSPLAINAERAVGKVLEKAAPGSIYQIISVEPAFESALGDWSPVRVEVVVTPPPQDITDSEFQQLVSEIGSREVQKGNEMSIDQIRRFKFSTK